MDKNKLNRWQAESLAEFRSRFGAKANCEALDAIDEMIASLREMVNIAEHCAPAPSHEGSCGPWSMCDCQCVDAANCAQAIHKARILLSKIEKAAQESDQQPAPEL